MDPFLYQLPHSIAMAVHYVCGLGATVTYAAAPNDEVTIHVNATDRPASYGHAIDRRLRAAGFRDVAPTTRDAQYTWTGPKNKSTELQEALARGRNFGMVTDVFAVEDGEELVLTVTYRRSS